MNCYIVTLFPESTVSKEVVGEKFPNNHVLIPGQVWVIGSKHATCGDVCKEIGIGPEGGKSAVGAVYKIGEYDGFGPVSLWDKISVWGTET